MKKSVLKGDLEAKCAPKMFSSKHTDKIRNKKTAEETAGMSSQNQKSNVTKIYELTRNL